MIKINRIEDYPNSILINRDGVARRFPAIFAAVQSGEDSITFVSLVPTEASIASGKVYISDIWIDEVQQTSAEDCVKELNSFIGNFRRGSCNSNGDGGVSPEPIAGVIDYSLEEQDTGQKWVDGKAIYQKTLDIGMWGSNDIPQQSMGQLPPVSTFIRYEIADVQSQQTYPSGRTCGAGLVKSEINNGVQVVASNTMVILNSSNQVRFAVESEYNESSFTFMSAYITVWYTKV